MDGPQQLVHHKLLEKIFKSFLVHDHVVEVALSCLLKFKFDYLVPSTAILQELLQKGRLRNALLKLAEESESIDNRMIPILSRMMFCKVTSRSGKSSKDSPSARRAAVLSCMSVICKGEADFFPFLYLMTRSFLPESFDRNTVESLGARDQSEVMNGLLMVQSVDMTSLTSPVVEGFLNLLEGVISQLGHRVVSWVPQLTNITLEICKMVAVNQESRHDESPGTEEVLVESQEDGLRRGTIRTLCFRRLNDLFTVFGSSESVDFGRYRESLWIALRPSLDMLPEMVIRNEGIPAMLVLLQTLSSDPALIHLLAAHDEAVLTVVKCIAGTTMPASMNVVLTFVENLLTITDTGKELIKKYTSELMDQFTIRLSCSSPREEEDAPIASTKKPSPKISGSRFPTWRRELEILFCVSQFVTEDEYTSEPSFVKSLCSLLVPFLKLDQKTMDEDKMHVLGILHGISSYVDHDTALSMYFDLGAILGPYKAKEGIKTLGIRQDIASLIDKIANNNQLSHLKNMSSLLVRLCSVNAKRVDEMDFEMVIPALNLLGEEKQWKSLCSDQSDDSRGATNPTFLLPIINTLFHYLHNDDGVVARGAFNGLKVLVSAAAASDDDEWIKLAGSSIIPMLKKGLQCRNGTIRRSYILLIRDASMKFQDNDPPCLCGDLNTFIDKENEDLDVFIGLTHLQLHRRTRAFTRLRKIINSQQDKESGQCQVSSQSISSVLLPLALHPVYESKQKSEEAFALEAIATIGALSRHLSWNKYNNILSSILSQLDRQPEQERYLIGALCAIIDGFTFELINPRNDDDDEEDPSVPPGSKSSVWRALEKRIVPKLESTLTKETTDKNGTRVKSLRPSILLALMKLFQKFPTEFFEAKLPRLLTVVCDTLRSKDSNERDVGRTTLAKMVCAMDLKYLSDVVRELAVSLTEGYKLHVRAAAIHTILLELSKSETNESIALAPRCVGGLMDLIQEDLFGEANERRESTETNVRYVKEAGGNKSEHSVSTFLVTGLCIFADWLELTEASFVSRRSNYFLN